MDRPREAPTTRRAAPGDADADAADAVAVAAVMTRPPINSAMTIAVGSRPTGTTRKALRTTPTPARIGRETMAAGGMTAAIRLPRDRRKARAIGLRGAADVVAAVAAVAAAARTSDWPTSGPRPSSPKRGSG